MSKSDIKALTEHFDELALSQRKKRASIAIPRNSPSSQIETEQDQHGPQITKLLSKLEQAQVQILQLQHDFEQCCSWVSEIKKDLALKENAAIENEDNASKLEQTQKELDTANHQIDILKKRLYEQDESQFFDLWNTSFEPSSSGKLPNLVISKSFSPDWESTRDLKGKTVAVLRDGATFMEAVSGWREAASVSIIGPKTQDVFDLAAVMGIRMNSSPLDCRKGPGGQGVPGSHFASHAEAKLIVQYLHKLGGDITAKTREDVGKLREMEQVRTVQLLVNNEVCTECRKFLVEVNERAKRVAGFKLQVLESFKKENGQMVHRERTLASLPEWPRRYRRRVLAKNVHPQEKC
ncbi:hypothetical protein TW65_07095 [Stemphylium lycopersici]|uniref:Ankyrin repeat domain n=1 Tax=Stemphylium lycopersici TaxID=183478 RepID=A0A364NFY1_STELY|nr:hypothetical protein TW65_07095 [Stemphylium lycopersici]RAR16172.1 ankyrin repeat domain [Stemphylium lycopersici]